MAEATSDTIETEVLQCLTTLDVGKLVQVCGILGIDIPETRQGSKSLILKLVVRFLHSEDLEGMEDHGHSTFLNLHAVLKDSMENGQSFGLKTEVEGEEIVKKHTVVGAEPRFDTKCQWLREFKISGTIGNIESKENLSYTSLSFQMEKGKKSGYSEGEIQTAVIKAIKHGSSLQVYLESKVNIDEHAFIQILRSHYKEKDSTSVFQENQDSGIRVRFLSLCNEFT